MNVTGEWLLGFGFERTTVSVGPSQSVAVLARWGPDGWADLVWCDSTLCVYTPASLVPLRGWGAEWTVEEVVELCRVLYGG